MTTRAQEEAIFKEMLDAADALADAVMDAKTDGVKLPAPVLEAVHWYYEIATEWMTTLMESDE